MMKLDQYKWLLTLIGVLILVLIPLKLRSQSPTTPDPAPPLTGPTQPTEPVQPTAPKSPESAQPLQPTEPQVSTKTDGTEQTTEDSDSTEPSSTQVKQPYLRNERPGVTSFAKFKETVARQAAQYPDIYFLEALDYDREVALTFDDGPDGRYTEQILDILKKYQVKATFFLLGSNIQRYPDVVKRIAAEGHAIGNHSYNHPDLRTLTREAAFEQELGKTQQVIEKLVGYQPAIFRPPYGAVTDEQIPYFAEKGLRTINWSIDTFDWDRNQNSVDEITNDKVFHYLHEGGIILMHSAGGNRQNTVDALPGIIEGLLAQGYQLKTVPELLEIPARIP